MIVFISCSKTKASKQSKAQNMYTSTLFKYSLQYARGLKPDIIYILSAKYGVLELSDVIQPYNKTLNTMTDKQKKIWSYKCYQQLKEKRIDFDDEAIFLTGESYHKYLKQLFKNKVFPMNGLGMGKRVQYLKNNI